MVATDSQALSRWRAGRRTLHLGAVGPAVMALPACYMGMVPDDLVALDDVHMAAWAAVDILDRQADEHWCSNAQCRPDAVRRSRDLAVPARGRRSCRWA